MNIQIRTGHERDIETMVALLQSLFAIEKDFVINPEKQRMGIAKLLARIQDAAIFVAETDGALAGMVTVQLVVSTAAGGYAALLEDMIVREEFRCRGVGSALFAAVKNWAHEKSAKRIQLLADERNHPAPAFYRRLGFSASSMRGFYFPLDRNHDEI